MTKGKLTKSGALFIREIENIEKNRKDYYFGIRGKEKHGHVVVISGALAYERYVSGASVIVSGSDCLLINE